MQSPYMPQPFLAGFGTQPMGYGAGTFGGLPPLSGGVAPEVMNTPRTFNALQPAVSPLEMTGLKGFTPAGGVAQGGWMGIDGLGANLDTLKFGVGALGAGLSLYNGFQQNKLAKASFNHQKGLLDTNLANSIKSYNLQLDDKLRSRQVVESSSDASREEARRRWEARDERKG
jgi:hypothetical protein